MKKTIAIIAAVFALALVTCSTAQAGSLENTLNGFYPQTFIVVQVEPEDNLVTIETATGFQYDFFGVEEWSEGDLCACIMYDRGTAKITDDLIVSVRYSGYLDMFQ